MAMLSLTSTNPDLSYIIVKNPATPLLVRENRMGHLFGFFPKGRTDKYVIWFKDSDTEVSYKSYPDESFEFVNTTRFNSAMFVLNAIGTMLDSTSKKQHEKDVAGQYQHTLEINMMYVLDPKYLKLFAQYFEGFTIESKELGPKNYNIKVTTSRTIRDLVNCVNLFALFNVLKNEADFFTVDETTVKKYLAALNLLDAPYFMRYVFKINLLRGKKLFQQFKADLEKTPRYKVNFVHGNTAIQREEAVLAALGSLERPVLDIGCGEGNFVRRIAGKLPEGASYMAVDIDETCREDVKHLAERKQLENVEIFSQLADVPSSDTKTDILMVEVIEHMPMADAEVLVKEVFSGRFNLGQAIITTPNKEFNQFYDLKEDYQRHEDHHFELTPSEFEDFLRRTIPAGYKTRMFWIGDLVNGIPTTLAASIQQETN